MPAMPDKCFGTSHAAVHPVREPPVLSVFTYALVVHGMHASGACSRYKKRSSVLRCVGYRGDLVVAYDVDEGSDIARPHSVGTLVA